MSSKSRRTLSISGECMDALKAYAKRTGEPHSRLVETWIREHIGLPAVRVSPSGHDNSEVTWE
jgi:aminopeptidase N